MNPKHELSSIIAPYIRGLLAEKRALGYTYDSEELILYRFDRFCVEAGLDIVNINKICMKNLCI